MKKDNQVCCSSRRRFGSVRSAHLYIAAEPRCAIPFSLSRGTSPGQPTSSAEPELAAIFYVDRTLGLRESPSSAQSQCRNNDPDDLARQGAMVLSELTVGHQYFLLRI